MCLHAYLITVQEHIRKIEKLWYQLLEGKEGDGSKRVTPP